MTTDSRTGLIASEIRFHKSQIRSHLRTELAELQGVPPGADERVRERALADMLAAADHVATHHAQALLGEPDAESTVWDTPPSSEVDRTRIAAEIAQALQEIRAGGTKALDLVGRTEPAATDEVALAHDIRAALVHLMNATAKGFRLSQRLVRLEHPEIAEEEARNQELDTPLRTLVRPDARALQTCPHCGASLGSDDRTYTGSYCEACRTLWEPSDPEAGQA